MKHILTILILLFSFNCFSQNQAEMNESADAKLNKSDKILNEIYRTILSEYKSDTIFLKNLKKSQILWIKFRDAEMAMKFPDYEEGFYGSMLPTCRALYLKKLTDQRVETLKEWVRGVEEGEACNGSVKFIEEIFDTKSMQKAIVKRDNSISMTANIKKKHRIFGYKDKDIYSEKMILLSVFKNEVKNNPFSCKYGAFYDTKDMKDMVLKYVSAEGEFLRIEIIKNRKPIDQVYMPIEWFDFEK